MKKYVATTALVAFGFNLASAGDLNVKAKGSLNYQYSITSEKSDFDKDKLDNTSRTTVRTALKADGKADNGMMYGGSIELRTYHSDKTSGASTGNAWKTYMWVSNDMGRLELGSLVGPSRTMRVNANKIASASGGIGGSWASTLTFSQVGLGHFRSSPDSYVSSRDGATSANKIAYYSPEMSGFQLGISYSPNTNSDLGSAVRNKEGSGSSSFAKDHIGLGVKYHQMMGEMDVTVGGTYDTGKTAKIGGVRMYKDLRAWDIGAMGQYSMFKLAGSYGHSGKLYKADQFTANVANGNAAIKEKESKYWTAGVGLEQGPMTASLTYMNAKYLNDETSIYSIGADYKLAEGLVPYVEANFFELKPNKALADANSKSSVKNRGTVFLAGMKMQF